MKYTITNGGYVNGRPNAIGYNSISVENREEYIFSIADFTTNTTPQYSDPEGDPLAYVKILLLPSNGTLKVNGININQNDLVTASNISTGNFKYVPDDVNNSYDSSFRFDVADTGSNTVSGISIGNLGLMSISVSEKENLPPNSVGNGSIDIQYGENYVFKREDFTTLTIPAYSDPEGDEPYSLKILSLPQTGMGGGLFFNGELATVSQEILFTEIDSGYLYFNNGATSITGSETSFNFSVSDAGSKNFTE